MTALALPDVDVPTLCLHCGHGFTFTAEVLPDSDAWPRWCSEDCTRRSLRARGRSRWRARKEGLLTYCPTPNKVAYGTWAEADLIAWRTDPNDWWLRAYPCACEWLHVGHVRPLVGRVRQPC